MKFLSDFSRDGGVVEEEGELVGEPVAGPGHVVAGQVGGRGPVVHRVADGDRFVKV